MVAAEIEDLKLEKDGAEYILCLNCELPNVEFCLDLDSFNAFITSSWKNTSLLGETLWSNWLGGFMNNWFLL